MPRPVPLTTEETIINFGPQHPSAHGVLRLVLTLEGEVVHDLRPDVGYIHRGLEKIGENRTYAQFVPYTDRIDYIAALSNNLGYCLTVEKLAGIEVPERAQHIRLILVELQRISSHLLWLATFANDLAAVSVFLYGFREREPIMDLFEMAVGARLTCHGFRIGGVMRDLPEEFAPACRAFLREMPRRLDENDRLLTGNPIFRARTEGVGVISGERATAWGLSGPSLRGSGVALDWRRVTPYAGYDRVEFDVATADSGDCWGRYLVRIEEMRQSLRIIRQCLNALPEGPVQAKVPRILRPPAGEARCHIEAPRGDLGFYLVSDGSVNPYRLRVRGPSFVNLGALTEMCRGLKVADVVAILGSIDVVLGEIDR